jgi:hypothetical protein
MTVHCRSILRRVAGTAGTADGRITLRIITVMRVTGFPHPALLPRMWPPRPSWLRHPAQFSMVWRNHLWNHEGYWM